MTANSTLPTTPHSKAVMMSPNSVIQPEDYIVCLGLANVAVLYLIRFTEQENVELRSGIHAWLQETYTWTALSMHAVQLMALTAQHSSVSASEVWYLSNAMKTACFPTDYYSDRRRNRDRYGNPYWNMATGLSPQRLSIIITFGTVSTMLNAIRFS
ncbi:unnamed protein product [Orchesella dallaii]|uniref:Uncharacterized protein n=1 Tax=Orchesella dallaii TaxID=48710 RepID=A0ABP1PKT4_9HEXA